MKKFFQFIIAVIISFVPGAIGMIYSPNGPSDLWYNALNKSLLTPDGWVFAVVWPILYFLLGIALYLIISDKSRQTKSKAYWLFAVQMGLNALWSYLFFGLQLPSAGLICLVILLAFSIWMMRAFYQLRKSAGYLIIPYIVWLVFAMYLNSVVVYLN